MSSSRTPVGTGRPAAVEPVLVAAVSLLAVAGSLWLVLLTPGSERGRFDLGLASTTSLSGLLLAIAAVVVLRARPRHPVGRLLGVMAVVWTLDVLAGAWLAYASADERPGAGLAFWVYGRFGAVLLSGLVCLLLLYPSGRLLPGRARPVGLAVLAASFALPVGLVLAPDSLLLEGTGITADTELVSPPVSEATATTLLHLAQLLTFGAIVGAVVLVWVRHRGADADERTRLRWLLWAGIVCVLTVVAGATLSVSGVVTGVLLDVAVAALALSIAVGLVRPGLVDVDALVAGTLTSAAIASAAVAADLAAVALGGVLLGRQPDRADVTVGVLVVAIMVYGPLRSWLGTRVHRLLFGRRGDRYEAVSGLAARLETTDSVDEQLPALVAAVAETFKVRYVRVEVLTPDGGTVSASHGSAPAEVHEIDIAYRGDPVGRLALPVLGARSMMSRRDQGLLVDLVRQAAVAIRARLLAGELQQGRERLVLGREEDRRRIRRDLHDGLGPALGGVALRLEAAGGLLDRDPGRARDLVERACVEVRDALDDVRRLVHDLRPPALDDLGLEGALRQQVERVRSRLDLHLEVEPGALVGLPAAVEVAAYRICSEAVTNVVRHADAGRAEMSLTRTPAGLVVSVVDDGRGIGPDVAAGVGLLSLRERAEELGGWCEVSCPAAGGTSVRALLPCGATRSEDRGPDRPLAKEPAR